MEFFMGVLLVSKNREGCLCALHLPPRRGLKRGAFVIPPLAGNPIDRARLSRKRLRARLRNSALPSMWPCFAVASTLEVIHP
jgi:hypothetical protein